jgi:hypothetical protein
MIASLQQIVEKALDRLGSIVTTYLPPLLAGLIVLAMSWILAVLVRWVLARAIKAARFERFLAQSGLSSMLGRSGRLRAARLVSGAAYWLILLAGGLTALSAFDTNLTSRIVETVVFLLPKLATAAAILIAGVWLGQYFARSVLVWACNEGLPHARLLASIVRVVIVFVTVAVAADHLDFARSVFLTVLVLLVGGAVLAASIAVGLGAHGAIERYLRGGASDAEETERSLWHHL